MTTIATAQFAVTFKRPNGSNETHYHETGDAARKDWLLTCRSVGKGTHVRLIQLVVIDQYQIPKEA